MHSDRDSSYVFSGENITKTFMLKKGRTITALDSVSFGVHKGKISALVGPDGSGKSTLLRVIAGLLRPDSGALFFADKAHIGYMPQKFGLYEDLTVQENLDLYADLHNVASTDREDRKSVV